MKVRSSCAFRTRNVFLSPMGFWGAQMFQIFLNNICNCLNGICSCFRGKGYAFTGCAAFLNLVQMPGPKKWLTLGVSLTHLVESRDLFFLEAEIVDNTFQWDVLKNMQQIKKL